MNKEKVMKVLKSKAFIGVVCFVLGGALLSSTTDTTELEESIATLSQDMKSKETELKEKESEIKEKESKIDELQAKVDEAKPWFDMKDEERKAEEARLAEEKAKKEAEEKAKAEEEARLAQEKKKAEEEAKKQAEAQKYNTGITYEDLARNPVDNMGKLVKFYGKIIQVMNGDDYVQYRMAIDDNYDQVVMIEITKDKLTSGNLLEDDYLTIEGTFIMEMEYETVMGDKRTIPAIVVDNFYR